MSLQSTQLFSLSSSVIGYSGSGTFPIENDGRLFLEDGEEPTAFLFAVPTALALPILAAGFAVVCLIARRRYGA